MPIDWNAVVQAPDFFVFPVLISVGLIVLGIVVTVQWRKVQQAKYGMYLKERLIERGFSADEIVNIVNAGAPPERTTRTKRRQSFCKQAPC